MDRVILIYYRDAKGKMRHWGHHCKGKEAESIHKKVDAFLQGGYTHFTTENTTVYIPVHQIVSVEVIECDTASEA